MNKKGIAAIAFQLKVNKYGYNWINKILKSLGMDTFNFNTEIGKHLFNSYICYGNNYKFFVNDDNIQEAKTYKDFLDKNLDYGFVVEDKYGRLYLSNQYYLNASTFEFCICGYTLFGIRGMKQRFKYLDSFKDLLDSYKDGRFRDIKKLHKELDDDIFHVLPVSDLTMIRMDLSPEDFFKY